jgi:hypothetical protein
MAPSVEKVEMIWSAYLARYAVAVAELSGLSELSELSKDKMKGQRSSCIKQESVTSSKALFRC